MNRQTIEFAKDGMDLLYQYVIPNISSFHIDFACGDGIGTFFQSLRSPKSLIIEYDSDKEKIKKANKRLNRKGIRNLIFENSLNSYNFGEWNCSFNQGHKIFSSASANFVFHEDPDILGEIYSWLTKQGKLCVLDYNIKGISMEEFQKVFSCGNKKRVLKREGIKESYRKHTQFDVSDCIKIAEEVGFKTLEHDSLGKYFAWVGQKN